MKMRISRWYRLSAERLSSKVLYLLVALAALFFVLFWFVGYDRPYDEDPNFTAPLFTDAVIVFMELLVVVTVCCTVCSVVWALKIRGKGEARENNVPVKRLGYAVTWGTVLLLVLTFAFGSSAPMPVNGVEYTDVFWLKTADMLIETSLTLIVVAIVAMVYGATKYNRKKHVRQA